MNAYIVLVQDADDSGEWWKKGEYEAQTAADAIDQAWAKTYHSPRRSGSPIHRYRCAVVAPEIGWVEYDVTLEAQPSLVAVIAKDRNPTGRHDRMSTQAWKDGLSNEGGYARYGDSPYYGWGDGPEEGYVEILVEHDWAGSYEFELLVVWRHKVTGELRAAADAGCSCPTPFADLTWEGMKPIRGVDDLRSLVESDALDGVGWDSQDAGLAEIKAKVHRALRDGAATR